MESEEETQGQIIAKRLKAIADTVAADTELNEPTVEVLLEALEALLVRKDLHGMALVALSEEATIDECLIPQPTPTVMFELAGRLHGAASRIALIAASTEAQRSEQSH